MGEYVRWTQLRWTAWVGVTWIWAAIGLVAMGLAGCLDLDAELPERGLIVVPAGGAGGEGGAAGGDGADAAGGMGGGVVLFDLGAGDAGPMADALPVDQRVAPPTGPGDNDLDGVTNGRDNCAAIANASQADGDGDGVGDACDVCPTVADPDQADADNDRAGDACLDIDRDGDGVVDGLDNCLLIRNADQRDLDEDGLGDVCDNCPEAPNPNQANADEDNTGDACDGNPPNLWIVLEIGDATDAANLHLLAPDGTYFGANDCGVADPIWCDPGRRAEAGPGEGFTRQIRVFFPTRGEYRVGVSQPEGTSRARVTVHCGDEPPVIVDDLTLSAGDLLDLGTITPHTCAIQLSAPQRQALECDGAQCTCPACPTGPCANSGCPQQCDPLTGACEGAPFAPQCSDCARATDCPYPYTCVRLSQDAPPYCLRTCPQANDCPADAQCLQDQNTRLRICRPIAMPICAE
ncbi:MAG: hypothetical protein ACI9U2_004912 [Bradymonadia bacterium]